MAVFRVEKTKDFTVMSNHHLRNVSLSLNMSSMRNLCLLMSRTLFCHLNGKIQDR